MLPQEEESLFAAYLLADDASAGGGDPKTKLQDRRGEPLFVGGSTHVAHLVNSASRTSRHQHAIKPTVQRPSHTLTCWVGKYLTSVAASIYLLSISTPLYPRTRK